MVKSVHEAERGDQCGVQGGSGWGTEERIMVVSKSGAPESSGLAGRAGMVFWNE